jgi:predicted alpha/beta superfamily hydrolase
MRWLQALVFGAWLIAPAAAGDTAAPIAVPNSQALHLTSALNGKSYALLVHIPATPPPPNGYPVLYLLDGDAYFGTAYDLDKSRGDKLVIVAIAYPPEADKGLLRGEDLTLPVAAENRGAEFNLPVRVGGLDNFLKVVEREIKPKIAALTPIDAKHQAFFGHSFGGLAVLHALFTEPDAFETFIIASPSIWWNGRAVLADEEKFRAAVAAGTIAPRVLICAGGQEIPQAVTPDQRAMLAQMPPERQAAILAAKQKLDDWGAIAPNAAALAARLAAVKGGARYHVTFAAFPDLDHGPAAFDALNRAVTFAQ